MAVRKICANCDGSGQAVVDFDEVVYENIEGACPVCKGSGYRDDMMLVYKLTTPNGGMYVETLHELADGLEALYFPDEDIQEEYVGGKPLELSISVEWMLKAEYEALEPLEL